MPWIESHTNLIHHRKVEHLADLLNRDPVTIVGHLHTFWHAVMEQADDGDLTAWSNRMIGRAAAYPGDADEFVRHLQAARFLDGKVVHDWIDYAGKFLTIKYNTSNPQKLKRIWAMYGYKYGKGKGKFGKVLESSKRVKREWQERLPDLTQPDLTTPDLTVPNHTTPNQEEKRIKIPGEGSETLRRPVVDVVPKSARVWDSYAAAYEQRYRVAPVRNASVNTMLGKLVDRLGQDEAAAVAEFYLGHNGQFYVTKRHPVNLLLADAEGLRTQWATGIKATSREAKNAEFQDNLVGQVDRVNRMIEDRKAANGVEGEVGQ